MYISEANKCYACYGDSVKWDDAVEWGVLVKEVAANKAALTLVNF